MKRCSICGSDTTYFDRWYHDDKGNPICNKCYMKQYNSEHREHRSNYFKIWHYEHREHDLLLNKVWYAENPDYLKIKRLERYATN